MKKLTIQQELEIYKRAFNDLYDYAEDAINEVYLRYTRCDVGIPDKEYVLKQAEKEIENVRDKRLQNSNRKRNER